MTELTIILPDSIVVYIAVSFLAATSVFRFVKWVIDILP